MAANFCMRIIYKISPTTNKNSRCGRQCGAKPVLISFSIGWSIAESYLGYFFYVMLVIREISDQTYCKISKKTFVNSNNALPLRQAL